MFLISIKIDKKNPLLSILIFLSLIVLILKGNFLDNVTLILLSSILSSLFILLYKKNKYAEILFENKFLIFIGNMSYSFYLWHLPIIYFYDLYFAENYLRVPLIFLIIITFSYLSFTYVEEKFRNKNFNINFHKKYVILISSLCLLAILISNYIIFQKSYDSKVKQIVKNFIYKLNYLENTKNYSDRTVFYKININGNQIYRFCTESSKDHNLNQENLKIECLSKKQRSKNLLYIEGNSHTAQFIPMINSIKSNNPFYYKHNTGHLNGINYKKINLLTQSYGEIIYATHISDIKNLELIKDISENFNNKVKILILGPIPNINNNVSPLKCFIQSINCFYKTEIDIDKRKLNKYYETLYKILNNHDNFYFYNPYKIICPRNKCYVYDYENDLLTHRDMSHLTIEGSLLLKNDFKNFYNKNFN